MKTKADIERRLGRLRLRYAKQHASVSQSRKFRNCCYNHEHRPRPLPAQGVPTDLSIAPRRVSSLVILHEDAAVHICMYGAENPARWPGDVCDSDDVARRCRWFKTVKSPEAARDEFLAHLADDKYVYDNHPDVAALQWALGERVHKRALSYFERLILFLTCLFARVRKPEQAPPSLELPADLWRDHGDARDDPPRSA